MSWTVLLDLYDTLAWIDWPVVNAGRAQAATRAGVDPDCLLATWRDTLDARSLGHLGGPAEEMRSLLAACGDDVAGDELVAELVELSGDLFRRGFREYDDVRPAVDHLRARGCRLAIVSNCTWPTRPAIEHAGLAGLVDAAVLSCEVGAMKPAPAILEAALERVGGSAGETVFVDDRAAFLDAGRALGMRTALIDRAGAAPASRHPTIRGLAELASLVPA